MRTKTLLLTMALGAAGVAVSSAQVYSVNAVGYVNLALKRGYNLAANPLNGTDNNLNTILPLPASADGATIFRFKAASQNYADAITFLNGFGYFTTDPDPNALVVNPGEGFFIQMPLDLTVTFVGEVPQGTLSYPVRGGNGYQILASQVPQQLALGDSRVRAVNEPAVLSYPAVDGDTVFVFNASTQSYKDAYTYLGGFGWFSTNGDDNGPDGPIIPVATSFFAQKAGPLSQSWDRSFSVN